MSAAVRETFFAHPLRFSPGLKKFFIFNNFELLASQDFCLFVAIHSFILKYFFCGNIFNLFQTLGYKKIFNIVLEPRHPWYWCAVLQFHPCAGGEAIYYY